MHSLMTFLILAVTILTQNPVLQGARIGVDIRDSQTGRVIEQYQPHTPVTPASVTKVITTAAALETLGEAYQYKTTLAYDGELTEGVLHGNLYIIGGCDPTLGNRKNGRPFLKEWVRQVQQAGIHRIEGHVVADMSVLDSVGYNPNWLSVDCGNYYAPCIFSIGYLSNTLPLYLTSGEYGSVARLDHSVPAIEGLRVISSVKCTGVSYDDAYVSGEPLVWQRALRGQIPAGRGLFCVKADIPNPGWLLAHDMQHMLDSLGVQSAGAGYTFAKPAGPLTTIYQHRSPLLRQIIKDTNEDSNNMYAELIARHLGTLNRAPGAGWRDGTNYVTRFWANRGIPMSGVVLRDGCGLAPANKLTAEMLVDLLRYMRKSKYSQAWYQSLPISGETGTLTYFCEDTPLHGRVHAKSGTMTGTKCYAGYITLPSGREWTFAVLVSGAQAKSKDIQKIIENYLLDVYRRNA